MSSKLALTALAAVVATMATGSVMAADLYGGGATFPAVPYVGDDYLGVSPNARLSTNAANFPSGNGPYTISGLTVGSTFETLVDNVSYCQTGSGFGKTMLNGTGGASGAQGLCGDFLNSPPPSPAGFSGASVTPDFIGTDAPYSGTDYTAFKNNATLYAAKQGITQIPTMAGAIGLTYDSNGTALVPLTIANVCSIYNKTVTNWSGIAGSGLSGTIKVVFRSDNSGTSFAFTSFLFNNCTGMPVGFAPNQNFTAAYGGVANLPAGAVGVSGNNNVVSTAKTAAGLGLGYADFGEIVNQGAKWAKVGSTLATTFDPANFGDANADGVTDRIALAAADLQRAQVLNGATLAPISGLSTPPANPSAAIANCTFVVKPSATISNRYPIAAFTYLNTYARGNLQVVAVKALINKFVANKSVTPLPVGFAYMDGNATHATLINSAVNGAAAVNCIQ